MLFTVCDIIHLAVCACAIYNILEIVRDLSHARTHTVHVDGAGGASTFSVSVCVAPARL